jgi:hypothetical protein
MAFGHDHPALVKGAAALLQRIGHIGQRLFGMGAQMRSQPGGLPVKRRLATGRQDQRLKRPVRCLDAARGGASSSTAWALVPPTPRSSRPPRSTGAGQSVSRSFTRNGRGSKSIAGFGAS